MTNTLKSQVHLETRFIFNGSNVSELTNKYNINREMDRERDTAQ